MSKRGPYAIDESFFKKVRDSARAITNLWDRSTPKDVLEIHGYEPFLLTVSHAALTTYESIMFLSADHPYRHERKLEFGLATSPLIRFLLDMLFAIIFVRLMPEERLKTYHEAGWKELKEASGRLKSLYGDREDWQAKIKEQEASLKQLATVWKIPAHRVDNLVSLSKWPTPAQMLKGGKFSPDDKAFLTFLQDWFYREFSQDAHMSGAGAVRIFSKLLLGDDQGRDQTLKKLKTANVLVATALLLAICSEMNDIGKFDRGQSLAYLWGVLAQQRAVVDELFQMRYRSMLLNSI
ncbi:MAG: hypothetical protein ACT4PN_14330 [Nitrospiraceae bacterium]